MRNFILTIICLNLFIQSSFSQVNDAEARAAYLLAEESYGKADYQSALKYIESAKKSLTRTNCKILYLQIHIERELSNQEYEAFLKTDKLFLEDMPSSFSGRKYPKIGELKKQISKKEALLQRIKEFQDALDIEPFNKEKVTDILKIKLAISPEIAEIKSLIANEEKYEQNIKSYGESNSILGFKIGQTLSEAKGLNPLFFEKSKNKGISESNSYQLIESKAYPSNAIYTDGNTIVGFRNIIKVYHRVSFEDVKIDFQNISLPKTNEFGFSCIEVLPIDYNDCVAKECEGFRSKKNTWTLMNDWSLGSKPSKTVRITLKEFIPNNINFKNMFYGELREHVWIGGPSFSIEYDKFN